jgi:predicted membrane channel-forming protein YqfA (hemolysin III family)
MFRSYLLGLTPWQAAAVMSVFFLTLIGALALAFVFHRWNERGHPAGISRAASNL